MPKNDARLTHTPIPTSDNELGITVARIYDQTKAMREVDLPRIETIATEAKDASIDLRSRVGTLETNPHECDEKERQRKQDENIDEQGKKINFIFMVKNIVLWIVIFVCGGALTFAGTSIATNSTQGANITNNRKDIDRHESTIADLPRKSDLKQIQDSVKNIPTQVKTKMEEDTGEPPTISEVVEAAEDVPHIKVYELKQIKNLLGRVEKRQNKIVNDVNRNQNIKTAFQTEE